MAVDLTVFSVFHNRENGVDESVVTLRDQTYPAYRVVLVDDESSDGTYARLRAFESDRISVLRQRNAGFTQTMMNLCAGAQSEFIALHGSGDQSLPERLSRQIAFLRAHPNVVAVGCGIENVDEISGARWDVMPRDIIKPGPIDGGFAISHGEVMFRRDAYLRSGGYRALFPVGQAGDLFRRLSRVGDFGYVPEILYRRFLRLDGVSAKPDKLARRSILSALSVVAHRRAVAAGMDGAGGAIRDDLDLYGLLYPYFAPPDRELAIALATAAVRMWSAGEREIALRLAHKSVAEKATPRGLATLAILRGGVGPLAGVARRLLQRIDLGKEESSLRRLTASAAIDRSPARDAEAVAAG
ncbi:hypothetical protein BH10PSE15_BH10PSE15_03520 [soil metagenome]